MKNLKIESVIVAVGLALLGIFIYKGINSLAQRDRTVSVRGLAEKEVKFFAKYALVPPVLVHKLRLNNLQDIADIFEVSYEAACYAYSYYRKWLQYGASDYTSYEITLLNLFRDVS